MILSGELAREGLRSGCLQQLVDQGMDCRPMLFPWVVVWGCDLSRFLGQLYHCLETGKMTVDWSSVRTFAPLLRESSQKEVDHVFETLSLSVK